jgi:Holliday junction resolvase RusA-like endonuclease
MRRYETFWGEMISINTFTIKAKLPSLNDVIAKNRTNRYMGAKFKKEIEELIGWEIKQALTKRTLKPVTPPCEIYIEWHESTKKRDADNVQSSVKFILDAMVKNGILHNDSRRYVKQIHHQIVDDNSDFVVVEIKET